MKNLKTAASRILLIVLGVVVLSSSVFASTTVVISQVYSGEAIGTPGGPTAQNDFVELFNLSNAAVDLTGWSVQIGLGATGNGWNTVPLSGTIAPGQYLLVRAGPRTGPAAVPQGQFQTPISIPALAGRVALMNTTNPITLECPTTAIDYVVFGTTSNCAIQAPPMDSQQALIRVNGGCTDTDAGDFILAAATPRAASTPRNVCASTPTTRSFTVPANGGLSLQSAGTSANLGIGYVRILPTSSDKTPTGLAVFSFRPGSVLLSEATVPAVPLIRAGQTWIEVSGAVNTGIAIANPSDEDAFVELSVVDATRGYLTQYRSFMVPRRTQISRFLSELPYGLPTTIQGTAILQSSIPVGIVALRGYTNERGEFLVTTLPVVDTSTTPSTDPAYLAHFAVGGGWATELMVIGRTDESATGNIEFRDKDGRPVNVKVGFQVGTSFPYSLSLRNSTKLTVTSPSGDLFTGSIRIAPTGATKTPIAAAVFSYTRNNVRVTEAGLVGTRSNRYRTYVEYSGTLGAPGSIQPGLAIANAGSDTVTAVLELTKLDGTSTGLTASVQVPGSGQVAKFVNELFPTLAAPFQGVLRVTTSAGSVSVIGLRGHINERSDFLITTVPAVDESVTPSSEEYSFPHLADSGGYTTQFILFGSTGLNSTGNLRLFTSGGQPLSLEFR